MRDLRFTDCWHMFDRIPIFVLLALVVCGPLGSGCFVIRGERRIKPESQGATVKIRNDYEGPIYCQVVDSPDFKMKVGAANGPARWELQFLFDILPINVDRVDQTTWTLVMVVDLEPKSSGITFDPWETFFQGTNQLRVPPGAICQDDRSLETNSPEALPVTNHTTFRLWFNPPHGVYLGQDAQFHLSIEGITIAGRKSAVPPILFEPTTAVRPGFRLPY